MGDRPSGEAEDDRPTPSYRKYPADYPAFTKENFSNRSDGEDEVLNDNVVTVHVCRDGGYKKRGNCHEALLFQLEDQRFEVDMAIDANAATIRQMEPVEEEISILRRQEETDGQPIGR